MITTLCLAAILAADVAGYSQLIGADEGLTPRRLRAMGLNVSDLVVEAGTSLAMASTSQPA